ncbi:C-terminal binding protein [Leifsonia sp. YAF41]|uniref:C-terminal binding protein n=1 Tax=Leifsonia sp. YAF41 TaxID=3233086 RepID=UPI003F9E0928
MSTNPGIRPRAVYTDLDDTDFSAGIALLDSHGFDVTYLDSHDREVIVAGAVGAVALLVGYAEITRDMIERMLSIRVIALMSMGFNNVDVEAAAEHGIWVTNIPGAATEEVATHALALALHGARGLSFYGQATRGGGWNLRDTIVPQRLSETTLGLVGLGKIGSKLAELARPLFGEIVGYDPMLPDTAETRERLAAVGVRRASLEHVRAEAHVLSLHLPLLESTANMVDAEFLSAMQQGSYLINVSRGGLVDSVALAASLDAEHLSGAGLDVLDVEPPPANHPLVSHPRVLLTPHIAYWSGRTDAEYVRQQAQNVISWAETGAPDSPVVIVSEPKSPTPLVSTLARQRAT